MKQRLESFKAVSCGVMSTWQPMLMWRGRQCEARRGKSQTAEQIKAVSCGVVEDLAAFGDVERAGRVGVGGG